MSGRRLAGVALLIAGALGSILSAWFIYIWYVLNELTFWTGPVYSSLVGAVVLLLGSLGLAGYGYNLHRSGL